MKDCVSFIISPSVGSRAFRQCCKKKNYLPSIEINITVARTLDTSVLRSVRETWWWLPKEHGLYVYDDFIATSGLYSEDATLPISLDPLYSSSPLFVSFFDPGSLIFFCLSSMSPKSEREARKKNKWPSPRAS